MTKLERIIISFRPIHYLLQRSKKWILPGFEGVPMYEVLKFFAKQVKTQGLTERASAISYNFVMAIPPTCIFLFTLIPRLPFIPQSQIQAEIVRVINDIVPQKVHNEGLKIFVESFFAGDKIALISFGFVLSLFFASNAMMGLMRSFNKNYIGFEKRGGFRKRVIALKLTGLIFLMVLSCLILLISQGSVLSWLGIKDNFLQNLIVYGRWLIIFALVFAAIGAIYRYAPSTQKRWNIFTPGGLLATILSIVSTIGFSVFVNNWSNYNALYDSIAILIVLMILIYINSLVILIGFEINVSIKSLSVMAEQRKKEEAVQSTIHAIT
ncbi:MAG: YihY/virulence factor BrkB family protein [Chitinophagaceae bacterium]